MYQFLLYFVFILASPHVIFHYFVILLHDCFVCFFLLVLIDSFVSFLLSNNLVIIPYTSTSFNSNFYSFLTNILFYNILLYDLNTSGSILTTRFFNGFFYRRKVFDVFILDFVLNENLPLVLN